MLIAIVQSSVTNKWGYCPDAARELLKMEYDEDGHCDTPEDCEAAARRDTSMPQTITFKRYPLPTTEKINFALRQWRADLNTYDKQYRVYELDDEGLSSPVINTLFRPTGETGKQYAEFIASAPDMLRELIACRALIKDAIVNHIYDEANGEKPNADCQFIQALARIDFLVAGMQPPAKPRVVIEIGGGCFQDAHSNVDIELTVIDYDNLGDSGEDDEEMDKIQKAALAGLKKVA